MSSSAFFLISCLNKASNLALPSSSVVPPIDHVIPKTKMPCPEQEMILKWTSRAVDNNFQGVSNLNSRKLGVQSEGLGVLFFSVFVHHGLDEVQG